MKKRLAQLYAIVRYETRMHWRRRGLLVIMVGFAVTMIGYALMQKSQMRSLDLELDAELARALSGAAVMPAGAIAAVVCCMTLPLAAADAIPRDRHIGVRELLDSIPLGSAAYLTGKLLGVWLAVMLGFAAVALAIGLTAFVLFGPFDLDVYVEMWIVGVTPAALLTSGASALLAAGQPNRRRAALVGLALSAYCLLAMFVTDETQLDLGPLWDAVNPSAWVDVMFTSSHGLLAAHPRQLPRMIAAVGLQVALIWLIAWGCIRWKENV